jgi:hypothetical protein
MFNAFEREAGLITHQEQPKTEAELQALLMEEYFVSQHPEINEQQLLGPDRKKIEIDIFTEWNNSGLREQFRKMVKDEQHKGRLDISLNELKTYQSH